MFDYENEFCRPVLKPCIRCGNKFREPSMKQTNCAPDWVKCCCECSCCSAEVPCVDYQPEPWPTCTCGSQSCCKPRECNPCDCVSCDDIVTCSNAE